MQDRNEKRTITARELDGRLKELMRSARRAEAEVAAALFELKRRGLFRVLGYARIQDYAEVELDMPRAKAKALVEVAKRLVALPAVRRTFEEGRICWTKARLVVRVATPDSEEHWLHDLEPVGT